MVGFVLFNHSEDDYTMFPKFRDAEYLRILEQVFSDLENGRTETLALNEVPDFMSKLGEVRKVPGRSVPISLRPWGTGSSDKLEWFDLVAIFDESKRFKGVVLYASRYSCFVSRDPKFLPDDFSSLRRYRNRPFFVTVALRPTQ
jgi:hypothetical protein